MELTDKEFEIFKRLTRGLVGINLQNSKRTLIVSRLSSRLRELGLVSFMDYIYHLRDDPDAQSELVHFVSRITTNETYFFREDQHFLVLERLIRQKLKKKRAIRIWSSACSSGEEPYTIAMTCLRLMKKEKPFEVKILASDISQKVLAIARKGIYRADQVEERVPFDYQPYFQGKDLNGNYQVLPEVARLVTFKTINLLTDHYPIKSELDIIFCRNVMIYFDEEIKKKIVTKLHKCLSHDGNLIVGHSESLLSLSNLFSAIENTVYEKV